MKKEDNRKIYVIGHTGNKGTLLIIDKLDLPFSKRFIDLYTNEINSEIKTIKKYAKNIKDFLSTSHFLEISKGGIFTALWVLAKKENVGMDFSQKDIPIHQLTLEICNNLDINPYRLMTSDAYLVFETDEWYEDFIKKSKISIACIGKIYNKKECARIDGDVKSYLTKDFKDEIDRIL